MAWSPKKRTRRYDWRRYLTKEESQTLANADAAKLAWQRINKERALIVNRAIHRAKYAESGERRMALEGK